MYYINIHIPSAQYLYMLKSNNCDLQINCYCTSVAYFTDISVKSEVTVAQFGIKI